MAWANPAAAAGMCAEGFTRPVPELGVWGVNREIDRLAVPEGINEDRIDALLARRDREGSPARPEYWLLTARLAEMALLLAGHYADHVEFAAAGDLLVNPRRVLVYQKGYLQPFLKPRRGRVSDLPGLCAGDERERRRQLLYETLPHMERGPLLPELLAQMKGSRAVSAGHLERLRKRMERAAGTLGFLAAWDLRGGEDLEHRLCAATPATRDFVCAHLCRFRGRVFRQLGDEIRRLEREPRYLSPFLTGGAAPAAGLN